jgi:hypothetical protein
MVFSQFNLTYPNSYSRQSSYYSLGLQNCDAEISIGAKTVLKLLLPHIQNSNIEMSAQALGSSYMGLRSSRATVSEVKPILAALNHKMNTTKAVFNAASISSVLNGLKCSDDGFSAEVRSTLKNIALRLEASDTTDVDFDSKTISNSINGLNGMTGNSRNLRRVIGIMATKIASCSTPFTSLDISLALYGIRNTPSSEELNKLIAELTKRIRSVTRMREKDIARSFYALQVMKNTAKWCIRLFILISLRILQSQEEPLSRKLTYILIGIMHEYINS